MNILGLDALVFGVDDCQSCEKYLVDYGLKVVEGNRFSALDGTYIQVLPKDEVTLPPVLSTGSTLRKTVYGVADEDTLQSIKKELVKDREVKTLANGSLEVNDDLGFVLGFQVSVRKSISLSSEKINAPGDQPQREVNVVGADPLAVAKPRSLSHVVYFVPDVQKAEAFYVERLGFSRTDNFTGTGPFLRPAGTQDHHTLFMIQTPPFLQGCEHFTFHMGGPSEVLQAGARFVEEGYESFWGPGKHLFGSNWFWYFNSPFGCHVEYDADMDLHDDSWVPRDEPSTADTSQLFLFQNKEKWHPSGGPPSENE